MESRLSRQVNETVVDQTTHVTDVLPVNSGYNDVVRTSAGYYMGPWETNIVIDASTSDDDYIIYLPPVGEAKGKVYTISLPVRSAEDIDISDRSDSEDFETFTLDAAHDRVAYYSNGMYWFKINSSSN